MIRPRPSLLAVALSLSLSGAAAAAARPPEATRNDKQMKEVAALQETFARIADTVSASLLSLSSFERTGEPAPVARPESSAWREPVGADRRYPGMRRLASATGFAMTADGYILTTLAFLKKPGGELADLVDAEAPDGSVSLCEVVGTEPTLNLAVLKLEVYPETEPPELVPVRSPTRRRFAPATGRSPSATRSGRSECSRWA